MHNIQNILSDDGMHTSIKNLCFTWKRHSPLPVNVFSVILFYTILFIIIYFLNLRQFPLSHYFKQLCRSAAQHTAHDRRTFATRHHPQASTLRSAHQYGSNQKDSLTLWREHRRTRGFGTLWSQPYRLVGHQGRPAAATHIERQISGRDKAHGIQRTFGIRTRKPWRGGLRRHLIIVSRRTEHSHSPVDAVYCIMKST